MAPCPPPLGSLDMSGIILTTGTFWLRTTLLYNYTINTHYTTSTLSGFQHILSLFSLLRPPPPPPHRIWLFTPNFSLLSWDMSLYPWLWKIHIKLYLYLKCTFLFLICRSAGLTAKRSLFWRAQPFMSGELLDQRERKMFGVMFHSEAQYENQDSKVTVNHLITRPQMPS